MSKTSTAYAQTLVILAAVAVAVHYLVGLDWPWAIVAGAVVSVAARAVIHRRPEERSRG
jgi:membrane protein implicated in regulation of membrane protease activity